MGSVSSKTRFFILYFLAGIAKIIYLLYITTIESRTVTINPEYHPRKIPAESNTIYVYWHAKLFMIMPIGRNSRMGVLTLLDWKNFFYDKLCRAFGYSTIPLTDNASAVRKLEEMLENGFHIALAVDGPRGPAGCVRNGAAYLAQKTKKPIISVNIKFNKSIRLWKRWDKLEIPLPFTRATFVFGEPIYSHGRSIAEVSNEIKMKLGDY